MSALLWCRWPATWHALLKSWRHVTLRTLRWSGILKSVGALLWCCGPAVTVPASSQDLLLHLLPRHFHPTKVLELERRHVGTTDRLTVGHHIAFEAVAIVTGIGRWVRELHAAVRGSRVREHAVVTGSRRSRRALKISQLVSVAAWWWTEQAPGLSLVIVQAGHVRCCAAVAESW